MLEVIKQYIKAGLYIFPLTPDQKIPLKNSRGFKDATNDLDRARTMWEPFPNANIGIYPGPSNHLVIDLDVKKGKDGIEEWGDLCEKNHITLDTLTAETPSGGRHHVFSLPSDVVVHSSSDKIAKGIDVRSTGGYIVAAPSTVKGGSYFWDSSSGEFEPSEIIQAPDWLISLASKSKPSINVVISEDTLLTSEELNELRSALFFIDPDGRDTWFQVGMAIKDSMPNMQGFGVWCEWASSSDKFDRTASRKIWDSFKGTGLTIATIYRQAIDNGWSYKTEEAQTVVTSVASITPTKQADPPGVLKSIRDYIVQTARRPQPELSTSAAISLAAVVMGRKFRGSTKLRTNMQMINIAPTGAGKDHPRQAIKEILMIADRKMLMGGEHVFSSSGLLAALSANPERLFLLDEFGKTLIEAQKPHSTADTFLTALMTLYTSSNSVYFGAEYADQKNRPRIDIEYPCACVLGSSTDEQFYQALDSGSSSSGFLSRFLVVETHGLPLLKVPEDIEPPSDVIDWIDTVGRVRQGLQGEMASNPIAVSKSGDAEALFDSFATDTDAMVSSGEHEAVAHLWSRAWAHADKLATIGAISVDPLSTSITGDVAHWAISFVKDRVEWLASAVRERVSNSEYEKNRKAFSIAINKAGAEGVKMSKIGGQQPFISFVPKMRKELIKDLVDSGEIFSLRYSIKGRPAQRYVHKKYTTRGKDGVVSVVL